MKRMLFNATQSEELRVAIVDGQKLIDLDIESSGKEQRKSNIYKGVITRIEPSLEAAFINYGTDRHGFLPFKEISRSYFNGSDEGKVRIQDALKEGQELIVQVDKDERGNKGAALTTYISLAGRYLVLMPNNPRGGGVSRRVEGEERNELRDVMAQLEIPKGMSVIARTAGIGRSVEELQWDLNYLLQLWNAIEGASTMQSGAFLIYQEGSLVIRAIRDYFQPDIGEILIDTADIYEQAVQFMNHVMPNNVPRVKLYQDETPLFSRFQIEHQIETAFAREVRLPSGGAIVIDHTEALVSIDVNSGRSTKGADIEHTAFNTNLEAADEVARQLRLRDLGGLVVIDFIDMENQRNQREVENRLREALHYDRARVQTGKISRFGLLELSRQRLRPSLGESNHIPCPRCHGTGHIRGIESTALHILRITQEEAMKENSKLIQVQLPVEAATFLLNEKRAEIHKIEARTGVELVLIPNIHLETPNYSITRIKLDDSSEEGTRSYQLVEMPTEDEKAQAAQQDAKPTRPEAAVKGITPVQPAPVVPEKEESKPSLISRILGFFKSSKESTDTKEKKQTREDGRGNRKNRNRNRDRNRDRTNERNNERQEKANDRPVQERQAEKNQNANANRAQRSEKSQEPREAREPRNPQQEQKNRHQAQDPAIVESALTTSENKATESNAPQERGERNRRNRNNRRDRDRNRKQDAQETVAQDNTNQETNVTPVETPVVENTSASMVATKVNESSPAPLSETAEVAVPKATPAAEPIVNTTPEVIETSSATTASQDVAETKAATTEKAEKKPRPARRPAKAKAVDLAETGLELVETKAEAKQDAPAPASEPAPKKPRKTPAWQKTQESASQEEPLVIVQPKE